MRQKILAVTAALALVSLAAVGAFASQEAVQEETPEATATGTAEATATTAPEATETPGLKAAETAEPDDEASDIEEADDSEGDQRDVTGIPDDNPVFEPNEDGDCEKHESDIKTTPSGNEVMVPCHAAAHEEDAESSGLEADDE